MGALMARGTVSADIIAGLSISGLLLPEAVAYSALAGLPPQTGVIALFAGLLSYGLIGQSSFAIVSATSSSAAVLASALAALGAQDPAQRLAFSFLLVIGCGIAFVLAGGLRLGAMSNLIARPVLRGYSWGLALVITIKSWPQLAGVSTESSSALALLVALLRDFADWHLPSLLCGLAALAGLFGLERLPRVPGALLVIVASILAASVLAAHGVALTGPIHLALTLPSFSAPEGVHWLSLSEFAFALMFVLYAESYSSIRSYALKHNEEVQPNRDLIAFGVANLLAGLGHGMPVGAGYSATSANEAAGARSRLAGLCALGAVLILVLLCLQWVELIPRPVLSAIVIHAVAKSLRVGVFSSYFRWHRDRLLAVAAVLAVLIFGVLNGLLVAIALSLALLIRSLARPRLSILGRIGAHDYVSLERFPDAATSPALLVVRPEEPLFFANAEPLLGQVREQVLARSGMKVVVLSLEESPDLDGTALEVLSEFCSWLSARGAALRVARLKDRAREALARAELGELPPDALEYSSVDDAVRGRSVSPGKK